MSELSPDEPFIATAGADPGRRKAAAHEARSAPQSARGGTAPDKFHKTDLRAAGRDPVLRQVG
jgi:hypothetical protein